MNILHAVKNSVQQFDANAEVILFGSRARGDFHEFSDWDFLILLSQKVTRDLRDAIWEKLYDIELESNNVISALIHNKQDWEDRKVTLLYQLIEKEGKRA